MKKFLMLILVACLGFFLNPNCKAETYFISDTHFGNEYTMKKCRRPYKRVKDMDDAMMSSWNNIVRDDDDVYILGDFASDWYTKEEIFSILSQLKGRKHLIIGNHDKHWVEQCTEEELLKYFCTLPQEEAVIKLKGERIELCHYPKFKFSGVMVHGHIHNFKNKKSGWTTIKGNSSILNAGVDINGFRPVTLWELRDNNNVYKNLRKKSKRKQGKDIRKNLNKLLF